MHTRFRQGVAVLFALLLVSTAAVGPAMAGLGTTDSSESALAGGGSTLDATENASANQSDLEPIEGTIPRDPNGDGLYEDFNANGKWGFPDVNIFFRNSDRAVVTNHTAAYDFDGSGSITL
ncbi:MAG: hypothetical protein ABEJ86_01435, partial [Halococcoides sp.]